MDRVTEGVQLTRNKERVANQGDDCPEVIPPEHAFLETEREPSNGDQGRNYEEGRRAVCSTRGSAKANHDGESEH